eukprot:366469-Chlamydomonas_euryale.AAC.12
MVALGAEARLNVALGEDLAVVVAVEGLLLDGLRGRPKCGEHRGLIVASKGLLLNGLRERPKCEVGQSVGTTEGWGRGRSHEGPTARWPVVATKVWGRLTVWGRPKCGGGV